MKIIGIVSLCTSGTTSFLSQLMAFSLQTHNAPPETLVHQLPLQRYLSAVESNDLKLQEELILSSLTNLKVGGAQLAVCPNNTAHIVIQQVASQSPLPLLLLPDVVAKRCSGMGYSSLLLLATSPLIDSALYQGALATHGISVSTLPDEERQLLSDEIIEATRSGEQEFDFSIRVEQAIESASAHCDAILLACSELVLRYHNQLERPTIDPMAFLAQEVSENLYFNP